MALKVPYLALAMLAALTGVVAGAQDAWPKQPSGNPHNLSIRASFFQPSN